MIPSCVRAYMSRNIEKRPPFPQRHWYPLTTVRLNWTVPAPVCVSGSLWTGGSPGLSCPSSQLCASPWKEEQRTDVISIKWTYKPLGIFIFKTESQRSYILDKRPVEHIHICWIWTCGTLRTNEQCFWQLITGLPADVRHINILTCTTSTNVSLKRKRNSYELRLYQCCTSPLASISFIRWTFKETKTEQQSGTCLFQLLEATRAPAFPPLITYSSDTSHLQGLSSLPRLISPLPWQTQK